MLIDLDIIMLEIHDFYTKALTITDENGQVIAIGLIDNNQAIDLLSLNAALRENDSEFRHFRFNKEQFLSFFEDSLGIPLIRRE